MDTTAFRGELHQRALHLDPLSPDAVMATLQGGEWRHRRLCLGRHRRGAEGEGFACSTADGRLVATGFVEPFNDGAALTLAVASDVQHEHFLVHLLEWLGEAAREHGWGQLATCAECTAGPDAMALFREAGLEMLSSLHLGGAAEVVLGLPSPPGGPASR